MSVVHLLSIVVERTVPAALLMARLVICTSKKTQDLVETRTDLETQEDFSFTGGQNRSRDTSFLQSKASEDTLLYL